MKGNYHQKKVTINMKIILHIHSSKVQVQSTANRLSVVSDMHTGASSGTEAVSGTEDHSAMGMQYLNNSLMMMFTAIYFSSKEGEKEKEA